MQPRSRRAAALTAGGALILLISGVAVMQTESMPLGWITVTVGTVVVLAIVAMWREGDFRPPPSR